MVCNREAFTSMFYPCAGAEDNAKKLYTAAYSLLLMHDVLKSKAGTAFVKVQLITRTYGHQPVPVTCMHFQKQATFSNQATLQVLLHLQKGSAEHLLSAYGEWFTEIASSGHTSWQDYLLDEV